MNNEGTQSNAGSVRNPLACEHCGKDLLDAIDGILVWVPECRQYETHRRYVGVYWWCKSPCQGEALGALGLERWPTHWKSIDDAANPLEFPRWDAETLRQIERGEFSTAAAEKLAGAKRAVGRVAARTPTADDVARYRDIRFLNGF